MAERTGIANAVIAADEEAQYDAQAKKLLGQKIVLAHILVKTVNEFKGMAPEDVVDYIEGEPQISVVPVEPGMTNSKKADTENPDIKDSDEKNQRIVGLNTENAEKNEGLVVFDIIFYVRMKDGIAQIIVNVECQKDEPEKYDILNRAIFYVCRLVSSQKERDFKKQNFDDIKQVFSIWVCMNMDENSMCHIHLTKDDMLNFHNWKGDLDLLNIIMIGITNEPPKQGGGYELHRLLSTLLSDKVEVNEKLNVMEKEYNIPISENFGKEVNIMCNLSEGIRERAEARGEARGVAQGEEMTNRRVIINMYKDGDTIEKITKIVGLDSNTVEKIIAEGNYC